MARLRAFLPLITLCIATLIIYAGSFLGDFHYDDTLTILENPHLASLHIFLGHLDHMVRPVLYATFLIDHTLYGTRPAGYHVLNLLLHLGSGTLVYLIVTRAVAEGSSSVPLWTALFFLIHPIATETVTYISGRASGLMALCYLSALLLYIKATDLPNGLHKVYLSGAMIAFLLAIGSKETAITFPIVLLLWDSVIRRKRGRELRVALMFGHVPFWIVTMLAAVWAWSHPRYYTLAQFSFQLRPFSENLLNELHAMIYSVWLLFTPWNQNFDHDLPTFYSPAQWPLPLELLVLSAMTIAAVVARRHTPLVAFGLGWFLLQLVPTSLIPRNDLLSERNLYLPVIGLLLAMVALGQSVIGRLATLLPRSIFITVGSTCAAIALVFSLSFLTHQRNLLYQDGLLLWSDAVHKSPAKARPHNNLGHAYALYGDWDRAIEEFRTAARLDPDFIVARHNLRDAYLHHVGRQ